MCLQIPADQNPRPSKSAPLTSAAVAAAAAAYTVAMTHLLFRQRQSTAPRSGLPGLHASVAPFLSTPTTC